MRQLAISAIAALRNRGFQAYLVGGCVRDALLNLPVKDFDIATSATPDQVLALFPSANLVGAHFGVVILSPGLEDRRGLEDEDHHSGRAG